MAAKPNGQANSVRCTSTGVAPVDAAMPVKAGKQVSIENVPDTPKRPGKNGESSSPAHLAAREAASTQKKCEASR
jgi:hypothetical protein